MKRYPVVIGVTVAGLAGIFGFRTTSPSHPLSNTLGIGPKTGGRASSARPATTRPVSAAGAPHGSTIPSVVSSATGTSEQYGYGVLSVKVRVESSHIVDVKLASLQTADGYSQALAQQVVPYLRRQVLAAQTGRIDGISGATYTSEAYALSLQSALDQLHFRRA